MKGRLLLDVVVGQGAAIFKLLAGKNQALLVWGNALLVLNLRLNVVDGIGRFDLKGDGLARHWRWKLAKVKSGVAAIRLHTSLYEDLHDGFAVDGIAVCV